MKKTILTFALAVLLCGQGLLYGAADIIAAPNPWVPDSGRAQTGTLSGGITFRNLPADGELYIYTLSGNLVTKQQFSGGTGTLNWDGRNDGHTYVASGVYFWVVKSAEATRSGKLIVIR
jgi:hypothetical protein